MSRDCVEVRYHSTLTCEDVHDVVMRVICHSALPRPSTRSEECWSAVPEDLGFKSQQRQKIHTFHCVKRLQLSRNHCTTLVKISSKQRIPLPQEVIYARSEILSCKMYTYMHEVVGLQCIHVKSIHQNTSLPGAPTPLFFCFYVCNPFVLISGVWYCLQTVLYLSLHMCSYSNAL